MEFCLMATLEKEDKKTTNGGPWQHGLLGCLQDLPVCERRRCMRPAAFLDELHSAGFGFVLSKPAACPPHRLLGHLLPFLHHRAHAGGRGPRPPQLRAALPQHVLPDLLRRRLLLRGQHPH
jgi:hypothetical protein